MNHSPNDLLCHASKLIRDYLRITESCQAYNPVWLQTRVENEAGKENKDESKVDEIFNQNIHFRAPLPTVSKLRETNEKGKLIT